MGRPRKAAERAIALGEDDPFDYALALELRPPGDLAYIEAMPNDRYVRWAAYMKWRAVQRQHAADVAAMRAGR